MNFLKAPGILCAGFTSLIALVFSVSVFAQLRIDPGHRVPADKNLSPQWKKALWENKRKVYKGAELKTIGMPCGGIAAGQLYVRGDGTLANWWIANNAYNTGYGAANLMQFRTAAGPWKVCYQTFEPLSYYDQGFSIAVNQGGKTATHNLSKSDFDNISFTGEYPIAKIDYSSVTRPLPVAVSLEVYSPFIPTSARESATPGTILHFTVSNRSATDADISLTGWMQNLVCMDLKDQVAGKSHNEIVKMNGMTSVCMSLNSPDSALQNHPYYGNISLSVLSEHGAGDADYTGYGGHLISNSADRKLGEKLTGAVATTFHLRAGERREVIFLLTWFFPNRPSYYKGSDVTDILPNAWNEALPAKNVTIQGNMYANWYSSSADVATYLKKNFTRLSGQTHLFHDTWYNQTTLPYWLVQRILMPVSTLATETCEWWAGDKFWAWEGVGSCVGTCTHVWNYEQALAHLFPSLERNIRERTDFDVSFGKDGGIQARNGWGGVLIDGHAGAILKAYREYLNSADDLFLARNWDRIKRATEYIIREDGNGDGLIEKEQSNTYDIAFYGANTYVGGLYLAALKAAAKMASTMHDQPFATHCDSIAEMGDKNSVARLWNGEYFIQDVDLAKHPLSQYGAGCLSDQLLGQTWSHLDDLGYIYPKDKVRTALESIWKYNWAPDVGPQTTLHPPERIYADPGEAGLLIATWPHSRHMGDSGVRYRDEVWTGIEYQVATNMIYEGMIEEGLSLVKAVHDRYSPQKHNPWNEIECGDHYARAMASWGVLLALENYTFHGPEKSMGFAPGIQPDRFRGFFSAAEGWGTITQVRSANSQVNSIRLAYGKLALRELKLETSHTPLRLTVKIGNRVVPGNFAVEDHRLVIHFKEQVLLAGQQLVVSIK